MAGKANFSVVKGDTFTRTCTFRNKLNQTPVNLTGCTFTGKVGDQTLTCTIINAATGIFRFTLSSAQTLLLKTGINIIEVQVVYPDLTVQTLFTGNVVAMEQHV